MGKSYEKSNMAHRRLKNLYMTRDIVKATYHGVVGDYQSRKKRVFSLAEKKAIFRHIWSNSGFGYDRDVIDNILAGKKY